MIGVLVTSFAVLPDCALARKGACCHDDGCTRETHADCYEMGGVYFGDRSKCEPGLCDLRCGDINLDHCIDGADLSTLIDYLFGRPRPIPYPQRVLADIDEVPGVTVGDLQRLMYSLFIFPGFDVNCSISPDTAFPVSSDTVFVRNVLVPPDVDEWAVEVWLKTASSPGVSGSYLSFVFRYGCSVPFAHLDSITVVNGNDTLVDTARSRGAFFLRSQQTGNTAIKVADLHFSLSPSSMPRLMRIRPAGYPPTDHRTLIVRNHSARKQPPTAVIPVVLGESCCVPPSDGADLALMIDGLFIDPHHGFDGVCLDEADLDFSCGRPCFDARQIDGRDLTLMIDFLFIDPTRNLPRCDGNARQTKSQ